MNPRARRGILAGLGRILAVFAASAATAGVGPVDLQHGGAVRVRSIGGLQAESAGLIMSGQQGGDVDVELVALPLPGDGERALVAVAIEIGGASILSTAADGLLEAEVYVYAVNEAGGVADFLAQAFHVDLRRIGGTPPRGGFRFVGALDLPPGSYSLRLLVRDSRTERFGLRATALKVDTGGAPAAPFLLPIAQEPAGAWLVVNQAPRTTSAPRPLVGLPPPARPLLVAGRELPLLLRPVGTAPVGNAAVEIELVDETGLAQRGEWRPTGRRTIDGGTAIVEGNFTPPAIEPGEYGLRAVWQGNEGLALPAVLIGEAAGRPLWPELSDEMLAGVPRPSGETSVPAEPARTGRLSASRMRAAFREALDRLASGDASAAKSALIDLETTVVSGRNYDRLPRRMVRVESSEARRVAVSDVEGLLPMLLLYQSLYEYYDQRQLFQLTAHARQLILAMVNAYLNHGGSREMAAHFLSDFASRVRDMALAEEIFRRALDIESSNEATLIGLASIAERGGNYREAVYFLDRVEGLRPRDEGAAPPDRREALLRQAICLRRLDQAPRARAALERLLSGPQSDWIAALARQELAALHINAGRLDAAERLLTEGIDLTPDDAKQYLLLAFVHDLRRDPWKAQGVLARLRARGTTGALSTRRRYTRQTIEALEETRRVLRAEAQERLPRLAAVVHSRDSG